MITQDEATRQTFRMSGLRGYDEMRDEAKAEVIVALQRSSRDLQHAGRTVRQILDSLDFFPTPAKILEIARSQDREMDPSAWRCSKCGGTSWMEVYELVTWTGPYTKDTARISRQRYEELLPQIAGIVGQQVAQKAMIRCDCKLGRTRAIAEQEEKQSA